MLKQLERSAQSHLTLHQSIALLALGALACGANADATGALRGEGGEPAPRRRICDGSSEVRLAVGHGGGDSPAPFASVLGELGSDFLYVDGSCHYWTSQRSSVVDELKAWRPYREGVLTSTQERELHDAVSYDDFGATPCVATTTAIHEYGATDSFRVDDAAAVTALRALRAQAIEDASAALGYFINDVIAIGPRLGNESYVMSMRDELPFIDAEGSWLPPAATSAAAINARP